MPIKIPIPNEILTECQKKNIAFEVILDQKQLFDENTTPTAKFEPLIRTSKDGIQFKLCEPNLEKEIVGPILEIQGMKMHISKNYKTSFEFSKQLAKCAQVSTNHVTLDLFLGLGYSVKECLNLGAKKVICFERYKEVIELVKKNHLFSVDLSSPNVELRLLNVGKFTKLFEILKRYKFDSVIIDPPKSDIMLDIYDEKFLKELATFIKIGARIAAYVPQGTTKVWIEKLGKIVQTFENTGCFEFIEKTNDWIFVFERVTNKVKQ